MILYQLRLAFGMGGPEVTKGGEEFTTEEQRNEENYVLFSVPSLLLW
jgi:hypothetical protein